MIGLGLCALSDAAISACSQAFSVEPDGEPGDVVTQPGETDSAGTTSTQPDVDLFQQLGEVFGVIDAERDGRLESVVGFIDVL